jgi:regulator of RNase E activity RraB
LRSRALLASSILVLVACASCKKDGVDEQLQDKHGPSPAEIMELNEWEFYLGKMDENIASFFLNFWYEDRAPLRGFSELGCVSIKMKSPGSFGMGTDTDFEALRQLDNDISGALFKRIGSHFVGRIRSGGQWNLYYYSRPGSGFEEIVRKVMSELPAYEYKLITKTDPDWDFYRKTLLPDAEKKQWLKDRLVVEKLKENNDDLSKPRPVDHFAYFISRKDREAFITAIGKLGFVIANRTDGKGDILFGVEFKRTDPVNLDAIHTVVMKLKQLAERHNGEYDGWGTQVVPKQK